MMTDAARQEFVDWFRGLLIHEEVTHEEFAKRIEVHRVTVTRWANGSSYPKLTMRITLNQLAKRVGYQPMPVKWVLVIRG